MGWDWTLFRMANGLAGRSHLLDTLVRFVMNDYWATTMLVLLPFGLWFSGNSESERERNQKGVLSTVMALAMANLVVKVINLLYWRWRPFTHHDVTLLFYHPSDSSFPSNAATVGFCIAASVLLFNRRTGLVLLLIACLFSVSRVVGGVHYPTDILGGLIIGSASAWLVQRQWRWPDRLWAPLLRWLRRLVLA
ncbi:MAG: Undecaprenyl-diphosphatase BcrC [Chloroflexi bacterium ADurb.Bin180]|nr:MAG: Undecaprenyl-diphosphatase BcrC [Chloroflexi bacterium ADurb.Bin180]